MKDNEFLGLDSYWLHFFQLVCLVPLSLVVINTYLQETRQIKCQVSNSSHSITYLSGLIVVLTGSRSRSSWNFFLFIVRHEILGKYLIPLCLNSASKKGLIFLASVLLSLLIIERTRVAVREVHSVNISCFNDYCSHCLQVFPAEFT